MKKTSIPYQQTGYFSKLITDYIDNKASLQPFYSHQFNIASFKTIIEERKKFPVNREVLSNKLLTQYAGIGTPDEVHLNIQNLKNENCYTVTTGHQLNLFTGPLYFIYKIITTINLAKALKKAYPQNDFVPVYWMATEDHDYEEVNHFNLFGKKYELPKTQTGAIGKMKLEGMDELMDELKQDLSNRNGYEDLLTLFSEHYTSNNTFTQATRGLVNDLFGRYGLVTINADDSTLKGLFINEIKNELLLKKNEEIVNATSQKLSDLGYSMQVSPRQVNLFYLSEDIRERIVFENNRYQVLNTVIQFNETELIEELTKFPEHFSPNVIMRPLYQEKILPNLAYIGGGGELAYWFQLKEMFHSNRISFPILVLRSSVLMIDNGSLNKIDKLGFSSADVFQTADELTKNYLKQTSPVDLELKDEELAIAAIYNQLVSKAKIVDPSLEAFVKAELQKNIKSLKNIESRLLKAEKQREEIVVNQIKNLKDKLFPEGGLQERHDNLFSILLFNGKGIVDELVNDLDPFDREFNILTKE